MISDTIILNEMIDKKEGIYMDNSMYHAIQDETYAGIITILDYETPLNHSLNERHIFTDKKVIIDTCLKAQMNQYRFLEASCDESGKILTDSIAQIQLSPELEEQANTFVSLRMDIVWNSPLTDSQKKFFADWNSTHKQKRFKSFGNKYHRR